jgi:NAD+ kinase
MTSIAIYGRKFNSEHYPAIQNLFKILVERSVDFSIYRPFYEFLTAQKVINLSCKTFDKSNFDVSAHTLMFSIGGDGTMLDSTTFTKDSGLPILGINTGRLGFLSSINLDLIEDALDQVLSGAYMVDKRTVLKIETDQKLFGSENFALNELTIHKKDSQSMIEIHAYVDGKFLNTYWADGLIIATPTGSTAYSLSCGGPIILPSSSNFILTPVAPHNLNVRPVLISDQSVITLRVEGRSENFLVSADSRSETISADSVITVMKNNFEVHLIRIKSHSFLKTLRNKLHWGFDERN